MTNVIKLLDEAKEKNGITSDRQLALAMKVAPATISFYRHGKSSPDLYAMQQIARMTGRQLEEVAAMIESETQRDNEKREYWKDFMKTIGGSAAILSLFLIGGAPAQNDSVQPPALSKIGAALCIM